MNEAIAVRSITLSGPHPELQTEYLLAGEGPPLLLLHGVGDSAYTWQWVMPALARTHRVYALTLPGFGPGTKPISACSPEFFTSVVTAFLDTLGLEQVSVAGNSLGGLVAMRLALTAPERVAALALVDSAGLGRELTWMLRLMTLPGMGKLLPAWFGTDLGARQWALVMSALVFAHPNQVPKEWFEYLHDRARDRGYLEATVATIRSESTLKGQRDREILLHRLPELSVPTLVLWGARDKVLPPGHAQEAIMRLSEGQLTLIPDCGHIPQVEQPEQVATVLSQFFSDVLVRSR